MVHGSNPLSTLSPSVSLSFSLTLNHKTEVLHPGLSEVDMVLQQLHDPFLNLTAGHRHLWIRPANMFKFPLTPPKSSPLAPLL